MKLKRSDNKRVQKARNTKRVQNLTRSNQQKSSKKLVNLKEVKNTKEVKTHILVFLPQYDKRTLQDRARR